jgi:serine/threonine-protein kinase
MDTPLSAAAHGTPERAAVELQLAKILASSSLRQSRRRCELLRWSVERALNGNTEAVKEHEIGLAVFEKPESWDPRLDPIVRVEFTRLRQKLREYYAAEGVGDPVLIDFPLRGYVPVFTERALATQPASPEASDLPAAPPSRRRLLPVVLAGVVLAAAVAAIFGGFHTAFQPSPALSSVAVLPFLDLSPGHQFEYLSDGFTDELTNALAMLNGLRVISRTSAFQFKSKGVDVREVGRALQVGSVVEGSILRDGGRMRVIVQLNRTADGSHLWQAQYDRETKDILAVQDEITHAVAESLRVRLTGAPAAEFRPSAEALNEYLEGTYKLMKNTPDSLHAAIGHFENAIRMEPRYALAYASLGGSHIGLTATMGAAAQRAEMEVARGYLEKALSLEPQQPTARAALALMQYVLDWNWPAAEAGFRQALAQASTGNAHRLYAFALMTRGRFAEAEQHYRQALQLDPLNMFVRYNFAILYQAQGRAAEARRQLQVCLDRDPNWFLAHLELGYVAVGDHQPAEALAHFRRAAEIVPNSPMIPPFLVAAYAQAGQRSQALALMRDIENHASDTGYVRMHLAVAKAYLGDADGVYYWLERSAEAHEQQALYMRVLPVFAPYQHDPRMVALERRVGLIP